jgi:hypothetical protein
MNKLTKVGCSALCGSLAAISAANAGDVTVTGGADMTWASLGGLTTGNPVGMGSNFTLNGAGELDNGWTFDLDIATANAGAYSATTIGIGMGSLGSLSLDQGSSANGIAAFDDKMPTAWEEVWGAGLTTGMRAIVKGVGTSQNIQYTSPKFAGNTFFTVAVAPDVGTTDTGDKGTGGVVTAGKGRGVDVVVNMNPSMGTEILSGLNMFVGGHQTFVENSNTTLESDIYEAVAGITYDLGPVSLGMQVSGEYTGEENTAVYNGYKNTAFGISFNINDDLSVSYGTMESQKASYNGSKAQSGTPGTQLVKADSFQAAYTMGGASIRVADVNVDNQTFADGANYSATIVSMGLAF